jgi:hypothetical protein
MDFVTACSRSLPTTGPSNAKTRIAVLYFVILSGGGLANNVEHHLVEYPSLDKDMGSA